MLLLLFSPATLTTTQTSSTISLPDGKWLIVLVILLMALIPMDIVLRIHIGRAARAEGAGKVKGKAYMIFAFVFFGFQLLGLLQTAFLVFQSNLEKTASASLLVEITSTVAMGELAFTARKYKRLNRQNAG